MKGWISAPITLIFLIMSTQSQAQVSASSWIVTDVEGREISSKNPDQVTPVASITKLATVMTILDRHLDMSEPLAIPVGANIRHKRHTTITLNRQQLIQMSLVSSSNIAAAALCKTYPTGYDACIKDINAKLSGLGMYHSKVYDSWGIDSRNVSTARDLVHLVRAAPSYPEIVEASHTQYLTVRGISGRFHNTNHLAGIDQNIGITKTGYTSAAGACIAMMVLTKQGWEVVVFMHGKSTATRVDEALSLLSARPD
jgi:D-alanyl-D-alanine endopeptidase (penicillin-binding protein 7)